MLRSAVMRLYLNLGGTEFQEKQSVNDWKGLVLVPKSVVTILFV